MKTCLYCSLEFKENRKEQKYCSKDCWLASHKAVYISRKCNYCGKKFQEREKRVKNNRAKYCSKKCYSMSMIKVNKKSKKDINRDYRHTHKELTTIWKNNRRAKKNKFGGSFTQEQWKQLLMSCNYRCLYCNRKIKLSVDHIIPLTKWNEWSKQNNPKYKWNDIENIQPLCISCNSKKRDEIK